MKFDLSKYQHGDYGDMSQYQPAPGIDVPPIAYAAVINNSSGNLTKEKLDKFFTDFPGQQKVAQAIPELARYRFIATILEGAVCYFGVSAGQKFVFSELSLLDVERTTAPLCPWIQGRIADLLIMYWDRICSGAPVEECFWTTGECPDRGMEHGGFGKVKFRLEVELKPESEWNLDVGYMPRLGKFIEEVEAEAAQ